jgi:hypothetical protein
MLVTRGKLDRQQKLRLARLLDMMYTPRELAEEIGFNARQVYRVYVPLGCPHQRDENDRIWINGEAFREWVAATYRKQRLADDEAFCLTCRRPVKMVDPALHKKNGVAYLRCQCPECGRVLARIVAEDC